MRSARSIAVLAFCLVLGACGGSDPVVQEDNSSTVGSDATNGQGNSSDGNSDSSGNGNGTTNGNASGGGGNASGGGSNSSGGSGGSSGSSGDPNVVVDTSPPTVTVSDDVPGVAAGPVTFTLEWNEPVSGFSAGDVTVMPANAIVGSLAAISDRAYTLIVTPPAIADGDLTLAIAAGVATDLAGNANAVAVTSVQPLADTTPPSVTITPEPAQIASNRSPGWQVSFLLTWTETVGDSFVQGDVVVTNGSVGAFETLPGNQYRVSVDLPFNVRTTRLSINAGAATDTAGNANPAAGPILSVVGGTTRVDYSGGGETPGEGEGPGGSAGDGGNPGIVPGNFRVYPVINGTTLSLRWTYSNPDQVDPELGARVFYQVLVGNLVAGQTPGEGLPLFPLGPRLAASAENYEVLLPGSTDPQAGIATVYRIRACNTASPSGDGSDDYVLNGYQGCKDSHEFFANGTITAFCPAVEADWGDFDPLNANFDPFEFADPRPYETPCGFPADADQLDPSQ